MTLETWLAFFAAATVVLVVPGPTILFVISESATNGRRSVVPLTAGVALGDLTAMTLSLAGMGALLAASATLFNIVKWIGALYLIYLGIRMWRSSPIAPKSDPPPASVRTPGIRRVTRRSLFTAAFTITALNPKSIAFFTAFMPQFIAPEKQRVPQLIVLGGTFLVAAAINAALYGTFAARFGEAVHHPVKRRWFNRIGGTVLISVGALTAATRRSV